MDVTEARGVARADLALHLRYFQEEDALARVQEIREVVRIAASSESGVVALARERASNLDEGTEERTEAESFTAWAQRHKASVTQAAIERQIEAEQEYEAKRRNAILRGHYLLNEDGSHGDGDGGPTDPSSPGARSRDASPKQSELHSPKSPKSPGRSPKWSTPRAPLTPRSTTFSAYGPGASALFEHLRPSDESGGLARVRLLRSEWIVARANKFKSARTDAQRAALALPSRQDLEATDPSAFYRADEVEGLPRGNEYGSSRTRHLLHVLCVSYRWQTPTHADPRGEVLVQLADAIMKAQGCVSYTHALCPHAYACMAPRLAKRLQGVG